MINNNFLRTLALSKVAIVTVVLAVIVTIVIKNKRNSKAA